MINIKDYELIGIFFQGNFKRFQAGELISLGKNYYFEKEERKEEIRYKLKRNNEKSFDFVLNNSIKDLNVDFNIKAIIGNNGAGKSTILDIIQNYYKYPSRLSFYENYHDNSYFNTGYNSYKKIHINDINGEENLVFVKGSNYDIIYLLLKTNNSKFNTISLNQNILSKNQNYSDFISNSRTFDYLKNTILMKILKVTDSPNKIKRITKVKAYNASTVLNNSKLLLIAQFFIVNDILKKVYAKEYNFNFLLDINNEVLEFLDIVFKLNLFNPKNDRLEYYDESISKILIHTYIFNLSVFIRNIMNTNSYENLLTYLLSLFFLYRNLLISEKVFDKHIFNFLEENLNNFGIDNIHYKNILNDAINNIFDTSNISLSKDIGSSIILACIHDINLSQISYSFIKYLKSYGKYEKFADNYYFSELNSKLLRLNKNIIDYINDIFSIKKGSSLVKNYGFIDINYDEFENDLGDYRYYLKSRFDLDLSKFNVYLKDFFVHDIQINDNDNDNEFYLSDLSSGEKQIIGIFNFLHKKLYTSNNKIDFIKEGNFNILIDEPEISLHLEWQRKFIYYLIDGINLIFGDSRKINLYIATHSPFIISDLEKKDVVFLHRNSENKTYIKNFEEIKKESNLIIDNTFIANIPELIRGPFFLEDVYGELGNHFIQSIKSEKDFKIAKNITGDKFNFEYLFIKNYKND